MNILKKLSPRSLYARFLMIIILPVIISQAIAVYMFYERHWESMNRNLSASLAGEMAKIVDEIKALADDGYNENQLAEIYQKARKYNFLKVQLVRKVPDKHSVTPEEYIFLENNLYHLLPDNMVNINRDDNGDILVQVFGDNKAIDITASNKRLANPSTYIFIMWMVGSTIILLIVSIIFLKNQVRSIVRLTEAADKFGKGHDMQSFKPQGAREIRQAAISFIQMRERIKRLITRRTQMLAGVSHDLRTPLTRMKLQLALMPDDEARAELEADIKEMEEMLEGYLDFARGQTKEKTIDVALCEFISAVLKGYKNYEVTTECVIKGNLRVHIKPESFKRCVANIVDNALRYGSHVAISAQKTESDYVEIYIDDDGEGIAEDKRKDIFQPFYRLEESRNSQTGGIGLGLAIAKDIVHQHGGKISLDDSPQGGLRVVIGLPL